MSKVIIIVNAEVKGGKITANAPVAEKMAMALAKGVIKSNPQWQIEIVSGADLWLQSIELPCSSSHIVYCPLTIKLPDWFVFPAQKIYSACRDVEGRRQWVKENFGYQTSQENEWLGDLWLPIVVTQEKLIYGSIIVEGVIPNDYRQPYDLPSEILPQLCRLADGLLDSIGAIPSVYLLQFRLIERKKIIFDRLWPFPATPAISSIQQQEPDLFACHWLCLSNQPISEILYPSMIGGGAKN